MISLAKHFGGARYSTSAASFNLNWYGARVHTIDTTAAAVRVTLPPANAHDLGEGGPTFIVLNVGANAFEIRDNADGSIVTVPASDGVVLSLADNSTAAGAWRYVLMDIA